MFRDEQVTLLKQVALNLATNIHSDKRGPKRNKLERQKKASQSELHPTSSDCSPKVCSSKSGIVGTKNVEDLMATFEVRLIISASVAERSALMMPGVGGPCPRQHGRVLRNDTGAFEVVR